LAKVTLGHFAATVWQFARADHTTSPPIRTRRFGPRIALVDAPAAAGTEASMAAVALVVMEPGSQWPGHVGDGETLVALRTGEDMLQSTHDKLASLARARQSVRVAVLACNGATDGATEQRRAGVAGKLLASVSQTARGRLVLTASAGRESTLVRHRLLSLAGTLSDQLRGTSASLTLKFTDDRDRDDVLSWPSADASWSLPPLGRSMEVSVVRPFLARARAS
jgi:hypothetical protein